MMTEKQKLSRAALYWRRFTRLLLAVAPGMIVPVMLRAAFGLAFGAWFRPEMLWP